MEDDNIYFVEEGNKLLNINNFPLEITNYLYSERTLIGQIINDYDLIVEIGCFDATYLPLVYEKRKKYLGIDIFKKNIEEANRRAQFKYIPSEYYELLELNAEELFGIEEKSVLFNSNINKKKLIIFPFNVIGNIKKIDSLISSVRNLSADILVSTFQTNDYANYWRQKYYEKCCANILMHIEEDGVRFTSLGGLNSIAYNLNWFIEKFNYSGAGNDFFYFGNIGVSMLLKKSK